MAFQARRELPLVRDLPGFARKRRRARGRKQRLARFARRDRIFPERLLLGVRQQDRKPGRELRVERVLVEAFDKCGEHQDVCRFPVRKAARDLTRIELARERRSEALVGSEHGEPGGMALPQALEQLALLEDRQFRARVHGRLL